MKKPVLVLAALAIAGASAAFAQGYPTRPVKVVVPWPPGQATDLAARIVAIKLSESLAQPFVVENRPGAGGTIGTDVVAKAAPDGYTLLAGSSGPISINPIVQTVPYDPEKAFAPISLVSTNAYVLVTSPSFPAANVKEFIALVRANPGKYSFASSGTGATAHLIGEFFNSMAQLQATHVPYKGSAPAITDIMNGQVDYAFETLPAAVGHIKAGRLKTYGLSVTRRNSALPDAEPIAETADLPGFDIGAWIGYLAPAGTPRDMVVRLSTEIQNALQAPDVRERFASLGLDPAPGTPEEMAAFLKQEHARYGSIVKRANIRLD